MPVVLRANAHPIILYLRCRPKAQTTKTHLALKYLSLRIQSPSCHMTTWRNRLRRRARRRRSPKGIDENVLGGRKNSLLPLTSTPRPRRRKKRGVTLVRSRVSTAIRKTTMPATAPSQKISVGLGNLCTGDWWWWKGCQNALYLLFSPIPGTKKLGTNKSLAQ